MYEVTVEELATLLRRAENAHAAHEKELGRKDDDWAGWYAKYILDNLEEGGPDVE